MPRSAAGPDLRRLLVGSEGTLAVVTEATLACRARPAGWDWLAFAFPDFAALADGLRQAVREQTGAAVIRGYDETDAQLSFGTLGHPGGCVGLLGFPAGLPGLAARKQAAAEAMRQAGASGELGPRYGEHWWEHRNDAVRTYAQIMGPERAFGSGVIVDTFEVAGLWSAVPRLYAGIREALAAHAQAVGCHLSHLYPSGSSLYFTFLVSGADDRDAEARYLAAWDQAVRSCAAVGGTITHHHGVGRLKAGYLAAELGETGVDVLTRIKAALDPAGIMNPGSCAVTVAGRVTSPFGPLVVIANPRAGRGKVDAALPQVERVLRDAGLGYRIVRTTHPGHATEAARDALLGGERYLVAVGGDGTVHEVVNGMISGGRPIAPDAVLGVVAAGSGCDFVRSFGLPGDAGAGRQAPGRGPRPRHRRGQCHLLLTARWQTTRYFVNIAEAGLGGAVVARAAGLKGRPVPRRRPVRQRLLADAAGLPPGGRCGSTPTARRSPGGRSTWWWRTAGSTAAACRSRRNPIPATACSTCSS